MSEPNPILSAIRALLKFKGSATLAEIARMAGVKQRRVLDVINANGAYVTRTSSGKITRVDVRTPLRKQLWESGQYYHPDTYGAWSVEGHCLKIHDNPTTKAALEEVRRVGGLGDSYDVKVILDTPENRAALEAHGLTLWDEAMLDDRLWKEDAP